jgi:hypothetical protein
MRKSDASQKIMVCGLSRSIRIKPLKAPKSDAKWFGSIGCQLKYIVAEKAAIVPRKAIVVNGSIIEGLESPKHIGSGPLNLEVDIVKDTGGKIIQSGQDKNLGEN